MRAGFDPASTWITLLSRRRHFGGRQWYFMSNHEPVRIGALEAIRRRPLCSRQTWGRQVAYRSDAKDPKRK